MSHHRTRRSGRGLSRALWLPRASRCVRSYMPGLGWLEDRMLLAGPAVGAGVLDVAAEAVLLTL